MVSTTAAAACKALGSSQKPQWQAKHLGCIVNAVQLQRREHLLRHPVRAGDEKGSVPQQIQHRQPEFKAPAIGSALRHAAERPGQEAPAVGSAFCQAADHTGLRGTSSRPCTAPSCISLWSGGSAFRQAADRTGLRGTSSRLCAAPSCRFWSGGTSSRLCIPPSCRTHWHQQSAVHCTKLQIAPVRRHQQSVVHCTKLQIALVRRGRTEATAIGSAFREAAGRIGQRGNTAKRKSMP